MFGIAPKVIGWHAAGQDAVLARVVSMTGLSSSWPGQAVALSSDHQMAGAVLGSVADPQLLALLAQALIAVKSARRPAGQGAQSPPATPMATSAAIIEVPVSDELATGAGLACGGTARILVQDAADLAAPAWQLLAEREPICLVSDLDGPYVGHTTWMTLDTLTSGPDGPLGADPTRHGADVLQVFGRGTSTRAITTLPDGTQGLVEALWPTPRLVVVGEGLLATALQDIATFLGWVVTVVNDVPQAVAAVQMLTRADGVLVLSHDHSIGGPVLQAALTGRAGYVGALGSRRTQEARARWLAEREVPQSQIDRVHGPAGLDVGARTPQEIAVSIAAEVLAVRAGAGGQALRDRPGPVHVDGLRTAPPRYDDSPV